MLPVAGTETCRQDGENKRVLLILSTTSAYGLPKQQPQMEHTVVARLLLNTNTASSFLSEMSQSWVR